MNNEEKNYLENAICGNYRAVKVDTKTFNRELVKRAIQKDSSLKEIYSNSYKKYYNKIKKILKKGEATQLASAYANCDVFKYLSGGDLYGCFF